MDSLAREKVICLLREAGDILEGNSEETILPGWDGDFEGHDPERYVGIRTAARAVLADGISPDHGTKVSFGDIGFLVRYIGDIIEE